MIHIRYKQNVDGSWYLVRGGVFIGQFRSKEKASNYLKDLEKWRTEKYGWIYKEADGGRDVTNIKTNGPATGASREVDGLQVNQSTFGLQIGRCA